MIPAAAELLRAHGFELDPVRALPLLVREREAHRTPGALCIVSVHNLEVWRDGLIVATIPAGELPAFTFAERNAPQNRHAIAVRDGAPYVLSAGRWTHRRMLPLAMVRRELRRQQAFPFGGSR